MNLAWRGVVAQLAFFAVVLAIAMRWESLAEKALYILGSIAAVLFVRARLEGANTNDPGNGGGGGGGVALGLSTRPGPVSPYAQTQAPSIRPPDQGQQRSRLVLAMLFAGFVVTLILSTTRAFAH